MTRIQFKVLMLHVVANCFTLSFLSYFLPIWTDDLLGLAGAAFLASSVIVSGTQLYRICTAHRIIVSPSVYKSCNV